jgi:hypothetical protein
LYFNFYAQTAENTNKKSSLPFRQAALFAFLKNFFKQIAAYLPEFIPQATTSHRYFCGSFAS